jgi:hypothetical protein
MDYSDAKESYITSTILHKINTTEHRASIIHSAELFTWPYFWQLKIAAEWLTLQFPGSDHQTRAWQFWPRSFAVSWSALNSKCSESTLKYSTNDTADKSSLNKLTREWSGWSDRNLTWNFARLQSPSSNDCIQNFSCFYAAQECEKIAQS